VICDIDGVLLSDNRIIQGAESFVRRLLETSTRFVLLTNYPSQTPADLRGRISAAGIDVPADAFYTSAMATAAFLERQGGRKAFVIGEGALTHELYRIGFTITETEPDFVIVGETRAYNWEMIQKASRLILEGARFIATNPDVAGPKGHPACGALCAPIERITGRAPYYVGKPNPWIMRAALSKLGAHSEETIMVGDNMATDILAGLQAGMETILVLTGVSDEASLALFAYRPNHVFASAADIPWPLP
jgi:NagD protein